jgi:PAS domain S-box-containing protein
MEVAEHDVGRLLAGRLSDAFFRRAPDALVLLDRGVRPHGAPHLTIVAANAAAGVLAGRPPDELVGRPGRDVVPAALRHGFENVCTEASRSGRAAQARLVGPGAASEWFDVLAVPDADGLAVAIRSPTGERVAADRLELGDRRLESILEALGLVVYEAEILPDGSWTTLFRGPGADRLLGLPLGDEGPSAEAWLQRVHGDDRDLYRAYLERMRAGEDASVEYRVVADDGRERRLHSRCHVRSRRGGGVLVGGMVSDVSEAQRANIEMVEARTALARVVAGIEEVLYTIELPDGGSPRVSYLSSGWERLVGRPITAEEATGALLTLVHPDDLPVVEAGNARLARGEQVEMVYRLRRPDGGERHLLDRARPRADTKDPVVADGIVIDVTDRLRSEPRCGTARHGWCGSRGPRRSRCSRSTRAASSSPPKGARSRTSPSAPTNTSGGHWTRSTAPARTSPGRSATRSRASRSPRRSITATPSSTCASSPRRTRPGR